MNKTHENYENYENTDELKRINKNLYETNDILIKTIKIMTEEKEKNKKIILSLYKINRQLTSAFYEISNLLSNVLD
jgi:hypothetical protein